MANFNFNKVIIGGRLTADPELKTTQSGIAVTTFSVAVNRRFAKSDTEGAQTDFFNVTAWRNQAEFVCRYFKKASSICVVGTIQNRKWTDQQGQNRISTDIIADEVHFVDAKSENPASFQPSGSSQGGYMPDSYNTSQYISQTGDIPKFEEMADDEELPF